MVVSADADIPRAARDTVVSALTNTGQACVSLQRVYVDSAVAKAYIETVAALFRGVVSGDPGKDDTLVGPLVADSEVNRISSWLDEAVSGGARIIEGGTSEGSVFAPTLILGAKETDKIICEEVFGPVLTVVEVSGVDEAIARVNDSRYGLNTSIYTSSLSNAMQYARSAQSGSVLINVPASFRADFMPYGGVKESGQGREGVKYAIAELVEQKLIILRS
jgi:acyl-CoA reductase-like NAD-dependent aldehyde dehydrogenase